MTRFQPEVINQNQAVLNLIEEMAKAKEATSAQIVLAWELAQRPYIIPIPGTTKLHRLEENLGSVKVELTAHELEQLNQALDQLTIDERYF